MKRANKGMNAGGNTEKKEKKLKTRRKQETIVGGRGVGDKKLTLCMYRTRCMHHFVTIKLINLNNKCKYSKHF